MLVQVNRGLDHNQEIFPALFGVPEIIGAGGKYQKPPGGASARSEVSLRYEMYKVMVRYSQCCRPIQPGMRHEHLRHDENGIDVGL